MTEPSPPVTPPRQPGAIVAPPQVSAWPTVVGIIAIVMGAGGILVGCLTFLSPFSMRVMSKGMPPGQMTGVENMQEWRSWYFVSGLIALGVAALLLSGGIRLLQRFRGSVTLFRIFAVVKILYVVGNSILSYAVMQQQFVQMSVQTVPPGMGRMVGSFAVGGFILGIIWGWSLPIFLLIWFSRRGVKDEVAGWNLRDADKSESSVPG